MAQVLVTSSEEWYQGISSLKNVYEKALELRVLKFAQEVFKNYKCFQSSFQFASKISPDKAKPDLILISDDLSQWVIVELELMGKPLAHTLMQLSVFSNPQYDTDALVKHCIGKEASLVGKDLLLKNLFENSDPVLLVVFDTYFKPTLDFIARSFTCKICVFEIYKTDKHQLELYRMSGDYPYVDTGFTYLKHVKSNFDMYEVERPDLLTSYSRGVITLYHFMRTINAKLMKDTISTFIKIPNNPFEPGEDLKLFKTLDDKLVIEKM